jgi:hypothetical protein
MKRHDFIAGSAAGWPLTARARQPAMPVIGVISPQSVATAARNIAASRNGLRELGYAEIVTFGSSIGLPKERPSDSPPSLLIWLL